MPCYYIVNAVETSLAIHKDILVPKITFYLLILITCIFLSACEQEKISPMPPQVIVKIVKQETVPV